MAVEIINGIRVNVRDVGRYRPTRHKAELAPVGGSAAPLVEPDPESAPDPEPAVEPDPEPEPAPKKTAAKRARRK